ncbi:TPA: hypothetical protein ACX6QN_003096 [Photobacterium damselae]
MITDSDLLLYSKELHDSGIDCELKRRNVTRNAYYAMFHKLRDIAENIEVDHNLDLNGCGSHERLIRVLINDKKYCKFGETLKAYKVNRVNADYNLGKNHSKGECYKTLRAAEKLFKELEVDPES